MKKETHENQIKDREVLKVCRLCNESFYTKEEWRDTCMSCRDKPMYPDGEAADEALGH